MWGGPLLSGDPCPVPRYKNSALGDPGRPSMPSLVSCVRGGGRSQTQKRTASARVEKGLQPWEPGRGEEQAAAPSWCLLSDAAWLSHGLRLGGSDGGRPISRTAREPTSTVLSHMACSSFIQQPGDTHTDGEATLLGGPPPGPHPDSSSAIAH